MAELQRNPRDIIVEAGAEFQRLAERHQKYEEELLNLAGSPYRNAEDLIEEVRLKKLKLHVKDEMERLLARHHAPPVPQSQ